MQNELGIFFSNLKYRLAVFDKTKRELDVQLASDFNIFNCLRAYENRMSDFIAELLNPNGTHGQGHTFLDKFLEMIQYDIKYDPDSTLVAREASTNFIQDTTRRIDITVVFNSGKFALGIENKPWAGDQINQMSAYKEHLDKKYNGEYFLVYLSALGSGPSETSITNDEWKKLLGKNSKSITYSGDIVPWLKICYRECKAEKIRWFLKDFISYVEQNFRFIDIDKEV